MEFNMNSYTYLTISFLFFQEKNHLSVILFFPLDSISRTSHDSEFGISYHIGKTTLTHEVLNLHDISFTVHPSRHNLTSVDTIAECYVFSIHSITELRLKYISRESESPWLCDHLIIETHEVPCMSFECFTRRFLRIHFPRTDTWLRNSTPCITSRADTSMYIAISTDYRRIDDESRTFSLSDISRFRCTSDTAIAKCLTNWITWSHNTLYLDCTTDWSVDHRTHDLIIRRSRSTRRDDTEWEKPEKNTEYEKKRRESHNEKK